METLHVAGVLIRHLKQGSITALLLLNFLFNLSCAENVASISGIADIKNYDVPNGNLGNPYALILIPPTNLIAGACNALTLATTDYSGKPMESTSLVIASLHGFSLGSYYTDSNCQTPTFLATIPAGSMGVTVYFKDLTQEALMLTPYSQGWAYVPTVTGTVFASSSWQVGLNGYIGSMIFTNAVKTYGLGENSYCQLGQGSGGQRVISPVSVNAITKPVTKVVSGMRFSCALLNDGTIWCWGDNSLGQIGNSTLSGTSTICSPNGTSALGQTAVSLTAGGYHACALLADGSVKCWGKNSDGQLGDNSIINQNTPTPTVGLGQTATAISAGSTHTCALLTDSTVKCWGKNSDGQLGDNSIINRNTPTPTVSLGQAATAIAAGSTHTCALLTDSTVKCWGKNSDGQLGDNSIINRNTPTPTVSLGQAATAIAAGDRFTCALLIDGTVKCWGINSNGQLGNGSKSTGQTPQPTLSLGSKAVSLFNGDSTTCVGLENGTLKCWGVIYTGFSSLFPALMPLPTQNLNLNLSTGLSAVTNNCNQFNVSLTGANQSARLLPFDLPFILADTTNQGVFYQDSMCQNPLANSSAILYSETSSLKIYYKSTAPPTAPTNIQLSAIPQLPGVGPVSTQLVASGPISKFYLYGTLGYLGFGCNPSSPITIGAFDLNLNPQTVENDTVISIGISNVNGTLYSDSNCLTATSTATILAGHATASPIYYKSTVSDDLTTLTLSNGGISSQLGLTIGCGTFGGCGGGN